MERELWERAKDIFEQALAIAPDKRVAFLRQSPDPRADDEAVL